MPGYSLPTFNMPCVIGPCDADGAFIGPGIERMCQVRGISKLYMTERLAVALAAGDAGVLIALPKWTPVRGYLTDVLPGLVDHPDAILVSSDIDTPYYVQAVWDVATGFANEYRMCQCLRKGFLPGQNT